MVVALATPSSLNQNNTLSVFRYFGKHFIRFRVFGYCSQRKFNDDIFSASSRASLFAARFTVFGPQMARISQMQQSPHLGITHQNNVAALASIAAVGATTGQVFFAPEMH
jgi:hypothetical protein